MKQINEEILTGERSLFKANNTSITHSIFKNGESPLKEVQNVTVENSVFAWKYPLWYASDATVNGSLLQNDARAGIWYTNNITMQNTTIAAPKTFRRSNHIHLEHVDMPNAAETLWACNHVALHDVSANGNYFAMNTVNLQANNFRLVGDYSFDGCKNIEMRNAQLLSKDSFWNCENITVKNSTIAGEYIGWNSKNLTFENCTIESLQGFCYIDGLKLINCRLLNTNLAFEYCANIDIQVTTDIISIKNPINGVIRAASIGKVIFDDEAIDKNNTAIYIGDLRYAV